MYLCVKVIKVIVKIIKITIYTWILEMVMLNIFYLLILVTNKNLV